MFHTIAYKGGYIKLSVLDGLQRINASIYIKTMDSSGILWDYKEKRDCKSLHAAKLWITKQNDTTC